MIVAAVPPEPGVPEDVRLVRIDLDASEDLSGPPFDVLSADERAAAGRFHRSIDRVRSAAARAVLRRAVGDALGEAPAALRFVRSGSGRPALDVAGAPPLDFNVAHGGGHALVAWSTVRRVGVDVEPLRDGWDWRTLARMALGADDARLVAAAADRERPALFFDVWSAKEALLKADGRGIADGLNGFSVLSDDPDRPEIGGGGALADELRRYEARWLRGMPGHAACLAWAREPGLG